MSVIKIEKTKDYTVMSNYHLREKGMSLKAKGLLSVMLSLPENWDYSISGLVAICKENETAIKSTLNELKEFGYLEVFKKLPNETGTGRIEYEYVVYEQKQDSKKQGVENLGVEFLGVENHGQLNTNKSITKKLNTNNKERKTDASYDTILSEKIEDDNLRNAFYEFIKMRKLVKKPMTDRALQLMINKLYKISKNTDEAIKILEQSIINNWQDVYPLKDKYKDKNNNDWMSDLDNLNETIMSML